MGRHCPFVVFISSAQLVQCDREKDLVNTCAMCHVSGFRRESEEAEIVVEGRVTRKKWFSSKLFFFDISSPTPLPQCTEPEGTVPSAEAACDTSM